MKYLDTNIFLRYLTKTRGEEAKAQACFALFQQVKKGEIVATTCEAVICEIFLSSVLLCNTISATRMLLPMSGHSLP